MVSGSRNKEQSKFKKLLKEINGKTCHSEF